MLLLQINCNLAPLLTCVYRKSSGSPSGYLPSTWALRLPATAPLWRLISTQVNPQTGSYSSTMETYPHTGSSFLADFGSYLGLFLGWSLLSIISPIPTLARKMIKSVRKMFK